MQNNILFVDDYQKRQFKILHLNGISANFCSFIICDFRLLLPEMVTYM